MDKKTLRQQIKEKLLRSTVDKRTARSETLCRNLLKLNDITKASVIAVYMELYDEISLEYFRKNIAGKTICIPKVEGEVMNFYPFDGSTIQGSFDIEEPCSEKKVDPSKIDVMIVPGRAFSLDGSRLGRGRGYYDKYISQPSFHALTIGVCFSEQISDEIPTEEHDKKMDMLLFA
ncbi:MAG: 5-formyltetrahydrofolate cyclo-ligase [Alistipes sp.]|nr:5-formyltetrahydrofolate cyclo-ligase [Candidatus Alistipes equi]